MVASSNANVMKPVIVNLTNAMLDAGMVSFPLLTAELGLGLSSVVLIIGTIITYYSMVLIAHVALLTGKRSYSDLAESLFGKKLATVVDVASVALILGALVAYLIVVGDLGLSSLHALAPSTAAGSYSLLATREGLIVASTCFIIFPLCLLPSMNALEKAGIIAIGCSVYIVLYVIWRALPAGFDERPITNTSIFEPEIEFGSFSMRGVALIPLIAFAYGIHVVVPPAVFGDATDDAPAATPTDSATKERSLSVKDKADVIVRSSAVVRTDSNVAATSGAESITPSADKAIEDPKDIGMPSVMSLSQAKTAMLYVMIIGYVCYAATGVAGYLTFRHEVTANVLANYCTGDALALLARIALMFSCILGFPVLLMVCRDHLRALLANPRYRPLPPIVITIGILVFTVICAIKFTHLDAVLGLVGATSCSLLSYMLPAAFYIRIQSRTMQPNGTNTSFLSELWHTPHYGAFYIFVFGVLFGLISTPLQFMSGDTGTHGSVDAAVTC